MKKNIFRIRLNRLAIVLSQTLLFNAVLLAQPTHQSTSRKSVVQVNKPAVGIMSASEGYTPNWETKPFDYKLFVENKGQFTNETGRNTDKILYEARLGKAKAYFLPNGITYRLEEWFMEDEAEREKEEKERARDRDKGIYEKLPVRFQSMTWINANPNPEVIAEDVLPYPYIYGEGLDRSIYVNVYRKITYKNLYEGIDVEYVFPEGEKEGFKYNLIIHPGANLSAVKMKYPGAKEIIKTKEGDAIIKTNMQDFTDHAPVSYYEGGEKINIQYRINGNEITFQFYEPYDNNRTVVIDPWTTNPVFTGGYNQAYDIDYDNQGNVLAYGGWGPSQLVKLNSSGVIQWRYNATTINTDPDAQWGDFCVDRVTGRSYIIEGFNPTPVGARSLKISASGALVGTFTGNANFEEMDRVAYNECTRKLVIGGGGTNATNQGCMLDTNMTGFTPQNVLGANLPFHDMWLLTMDPSGSTCYMGSTESCCNNNTSYDNRLLKLNVPALTASTFNINSRTAFGTWMPEGTSNVLYMTWSGVPANGFNGLTCSKNFLYFYDGVDLRKVNKTTGASIAARTNVGNNMQSYGGLDVDVCDNVYVGSNSKIYVFNGSTLATSSAPTATITCSSTVYDLVLGPNYSTFYACGNGFVSSFNIASPPVTFTNTSTNPTCGSCNGSITAGLYECSVAASGATYAWSDGQTTQTASNLCAGTYTVTVTPSGECRKYTSVVTLTNAGALTPTINAAPATLCSGASTVLTASGASTYTWSANAGSATTNTVSVTPGGTTVYTVTGTSGSCTGTQTVSITVNNTPTVSITGTSSLCSGNSVVLTGGTATNYTWLPGGVTTSTISVTPSAGNTTYTLTGANGSCTATTSITLTVTATPTLTVNSPSICSGQSAVLTAGTANSYSWSTSATTNTISVNPASTTVYTVTGDNGNGCTVTKTATVTVNNTPTLSISGATPICSGNSLVLTGGTATSYTWLPGGVNTSTISITPPAGTNTYTLQGANGTCTASTVVFVDVTPTPTINITGASPICSGQSIILTGGTASTYTWSANAGAGIHTNTVSVSPTTTDTYTLAGTTGLCTSSATVSVTVNPTPTLSVGGGTYTICNGNSTLISASGATSYTWTTGSGLSCTACATPTASPGSTTTYTVTGATAGCNSAPAQVTVNVNPLPNITATPNSNNICSSTSTTITANGGNTYTWSPAGSLSSPNGSPVTATPTASTTYTITGTDNNGCQNASTVSITVAPTPTMNISAVPNAVCAGQSVVLSGGTASNYTWSANAGGVNTATTSVTPSATDTYTLTGAIGACTASTTVSVPVNPLPVIGTASITAAPCGQSTGCINSVSVSGGTPTYTYSWNGGAGSTSSQFCNQNAGTYSLTVTDANGCQASQNFSIPNINGPAAPAVAATNTVVCIGSTVVLNVNPPATNTTYTWTDNTGTHSGTTYTITNITPAGSYSVNVTATDSNGCVSAATVVPITVNALPSVTASASSSAVCAGQSAVLTAGGATSYTWSPGSATTNTLSVNPSATTVYTVTGNDNGCVSSQTVAVTVNPTPTVNIVASANNLCSGQSTVLTAGGAHSYTWAPGGVASNTLSVTPNATTSYTVTGDSLSCTMQQVVTVTVTTTPTVSAVSTASVICSTQSATLTANGATNYSWTPGGSGGSIVVNPTVNTTYTVIGLNGNCSDTTTVDVGVTPTPTLSVASTGTAVCAGQTATLTVSGATSYTWQPNGVSNDTLTDAPQNTTTYTVTGDNAGCTSTQQITVVVNQLPLLSTVGNQTVCSGSPVNAINYNSGGATVNWTNTNANVGIAAGGSGNIAGYTAPNVTNQETGVITATPVDNGTGCQGLAQSYTVIVNPIPQANGGMADSALCGNANGGITGINVTGGTPTYTYQWYNNGVLMPGETNPTLSNAGIGTYSVLITDANGCTVPAGATSFTVNGSPAVLASITPPLSQGQAPLNVSFTNNSTGATTYVWDFGNGQVSNQQTPPAMSYTAPGTYTVVMLANNGGCMDTATAIVIIDAATSIVIPNIYSPNGDGINDTWFITCTGIRELHCDIFNRWGQLVYQLQGINDVWNGVMNNGNHASEGTYYYILDATGYDGKTYKSHGSLTLVK